MQGPMIHAPVRATMKKIGDEWRMVDAEYADVSADAIARMLLGAFGVPAVPAGDEGQSI